MGNLVRSIFLGVRKDVGDKPQARSSPEDHGLCISGKAGGGEGEAEGGGEAKGERSLHFLNGPPPANFPLETFLNKKSTCFIEKGEIMAEKKHEKYACHFEYNPSKFNQRSGAYKDDSSAATTVVFIVLIFCILCLIGALIWEYFHFCKNEPFQGKSSFALRSATNYRQSSSKGNRRMSSLKGRRSKTGKSTIGKVKNTKNSSSK